MEIRAKTSLRSKCKTTFSENQRPPEAAFYTGISLSKLAKLRMKPFRHLGPKFIRVAGCIIYRKSDLDAWLNAHIVELDTTSSDGKAAR